MTQLDLADADELRRLAGWNQTITDWCLLLSFEPHGCFAAVDTNTVVGTVTTTTYGRELAWIGMMLVHPAHRRRGIGTSLMRAALDYLQGVGIQCIRLDATPAGLPVYEKLGFVPEWTLTRHQATVSAHKTQDVRELLESDWPAIEVLDVAAFGVDRARILCSLVEESRAALVWPATGLVCGYGILRPGSHCDYLGPLVCANAEAAQALVSALLHRAQGRSVFWDVPDGHAVATELANQFRFTPVRPLTRMRLGTCSVRSEPKGQFGIADPSLG